LGISEGVIETLKVLVKVLISRKRR